MITDTDIQKITQSLKGTFITKEDTSQFATKLDLSNFVTKDELKKALEPYATKADLQAGLENTKTELRKEIHMMKDTIINEIQILVNIIGEMSTKIDKLFDVTYNHKLRLDNYEERLLKLETRNNR